MTGAWEAGVAELARLLRNRPAVVLTGAGCSTESGVPDYRGPEGRLRARQPVLYQEFVRDPVARARYWARSAVGWPRFRRALPNPAHQALATLEAVGAVRSVITQNVDGLHSEAGSRRVLELHGTLARVRCLACGALEPRDSVQQRIHAMNPTLPAPDGRLAPDGDAEVREEALPRFRVPPCRVCTGDLKPDVVFFGENVPRERVDRAWKLFGEGRILLVVGSSLTVFSGRRFVLRAVERGIPVAIVNVGSTRCDEVAALKLDGRAGRILPRLAARLQSRPESGTRTPASRADRASGSPSSSPGFT